jgi:hypothetical protein
MYEAWFGFGSAGAPTALDGATVASTTHIAATMVRDISSSWRVNWRLDARRRLRVRRSMDPERLGVYVPDVPGAWLTVRSRRG